MGKTTKNANAPDQGKKRSGKLKRVSHGTHRAKRHPTSPMVESQRKREVPAVG